MRVLHLVAVTASLASALVIPDEQVLASLEIEQHREHDTTDNGLFHHAADILHSSQKSVIDGVHEFRHALDDALEAAAAAQEQQHGNGAVGDGYQLDEDDDSYVIQSDYIDHDLGYRYDLLQDVNDNDGEHGRDRPHHPHHHPHHGQSDLTIYELISRSKYTTKLAKLVDQDEELVQLLNSTKANYTVFAPTDDAFAKIPKDHPEPSKEFLRNVLLYHISPGVYSAGRVFYSHTLPTLYNETGLGENLPQRISIRKGWRGLTVNFYARIVAVNIGASNGIIHGINSLLIPPPPSLTILDLMPSEFSTLTLALTKTSLLPVVNASLTSHKGSTFFAPNNAAFRALGPRVNAFLFSTKEGEKHLRALLKYHIVHNQTLYSDVLYTSDGEIEPLFPPNMPPQQRAHVDLPTLLLSMGDGAGSESERTRSTNLAVDVARWGPFVIMRVNGFHTVAVADGVTKDGSLHVVNRVLVPPRKVKAVVEGFGEEEEEEEEEAELSVEEFKERLRPYMSEEEEEEEEKEEEEEGGAFSSIFERLDW